MTDLSPFFPGTGCPPEAIAAGFRDGDRGTHTSRTSMVAELADLLAACPDATTRADFTTAIVDGNALGKATHATRKLTAQRLAELYGLDNAIPLFRLLRGLWRLDPDGRPQLATLIALARDPLFRASAPAVVTLAMGDAPEKTEVSRVVREVTGARFNDDILGKIARNALASWSRSGHLEGHVKKFRRRLEPTPYSVALAIHLAGLAGHVPARALASGWLAVLDLDESRAAEAARDAHRRGLIDYRAGTGVVELSTARLLAVAGVADVTH
jgi:hypothetical protein